MPAAALRAISLILVAALMLGCRAGEDSDREVVVFAAASLAEAFTQIAKDFENAHPGLDVKLSFAGSQSLRAQIQHGARPDVFASANVLHAEMLQRRGLIDTPVIFAHNAMVIVVPASNPAGIEKLAELPDARRLVLAQQAVPAGAYADAVLAKMGPDFVAKVHARVVSREPNVRQVLQKVVLGEADAAIVYATDAAVATDRVEIIPIPREHNVVAAYSIAVVTGSARGELLVDHVQSRAGQDTLARFGFGANDR